MSLSVRLYCKSVCGWVCVFVYSCTILKTKWKRVHKCAHVEVHEAAQAQGLLKASDRVSEGVCKRSPFSPSTEFGMDGGGPERRGQGKTRGPSGKSHPPKNVGQQFAVTKGTTIRRQPGNHLTTLLPALHPYAWHEMARKGPARAVLQTLIVCKYVRWGTMHMLG